MKILGDGSFDIVFGVIDMIILNHILHHRKWHNIIIHPFTDAIHMLHAFFRSNPVTLEDRASNRSQVENYYVLL